MSFAAEPKSPGVLFRRKKLMRSCGWPHWPARRLRLCTSNGQAIYLKLIVSLIIVILIIVSTTASAALVVLLNDGAADALDFLLLLLDLLGVRVRVAREPILAVLDGVVDRLPM